MQSTAGGAVPIFERYFAGSTGTVRGFDYRGIGPVDEPTGDHIGGDVRLIVNAEYEFPFPIADHPDLIHIVGFIDAGKVARKPGDLNPSGPSVGAGFGLRLRVIPQIPISVDFGVPVVRHANDDARIFTFSWARDFLSS